MPESFQKRHFEQPAGPRRNAKPPGRRHRRRGVRVAAVHVGLASLAVLMMLPFVWMMLTALCTLEEIGDGNWLPGHGWQWSNFRRVLTEIPFARFYWNSLFVAAWVTLLQLFTSSLAAFSFSRLQWPGRDKLFLLYLCTMMLPGLVMLIPTFQIMISLRLVDTLAGLILPAACGAFGTFFLRQFMLSIPRSLDEAAEIDAAGPWQIYWEIVLPLSRPALVALAIITFVGNYTGLFWPLVLLRSPHNYTLPVGLLYFESSNAQDTNVLMAATTMTMAPLLALVAFLQPYLLQGIRMGATRG